MSRRWLRAATKNDRPFVEYVYFQTQRHIIDALFGWRGGEIERAKFDEFYDMAATSIIIEDDTEIGWMAVRHHLDHVELEHLYLDQSHQGRGIGSAILRGIIAKAEASDLPLRLSTAKMNRARRLYRRLGFIEVGSDEFKVYMERRTNSNALDELLSDRGAEWWDSVFTDRASSCPFLVDVPDETLVNDFERGVLRPGRVLELGCGNGRNAIYMASLDCLVDAVDFSEVAIAWARERARAAGQQVRYIHSSIFDLDVLPGTYDIVYDSGCFHHVAPHCRDAYVNLVSLALKPGGMLCIVCFGPESGSKLTDAEVYERRTLGGGLSYSQDRLREFFDPYFDQVDIRRMNEMPADAGSYGKDFLIAVRMIKHGHANEKPDL